MLDYCFYDGPPSPVLAQTRLFTQVDTKACIPPVVSVAMLSAEAVWKRDRDPALARGMAQVGWDAQPALKATLAARLRGFRWPRLGRMGVSESMLRLRGAHQPSDAEQGNHSFGVVRPEHSAPSRCGRSSP